MTIYLFRIIIYNDDHPDQVATSITIDGHPAEDKDVAREYGKKASKKFFGKLKTSIHVIWMSTKEI